MPLNGDVQPQFLRSPYLLGAVASLAGALALMDLMWMSRRASLRWPPAMGLLICYALILSVSTATQELPTVRYALLAPFLIAILGYVATEARRPGSFLAVAYSVGFLHIGFAAISNIRTTEFGGGLRLMGFTSPVFLGFEAACTLIVAMIYAFRRRGRTPHMLVGALCLYVLVTTVSSSAYIALGTSAVVVFTVASRGKRLIRVLVVAAGLFALYLTAFPAVLSLLAKGDASSLGTASGRFNIWASALPLFDRWISGYGFAAMRDSFGPDAHIALATRGLPLESSFLQVLFMGGIAALAVWLGIVLQGTRQLLSARESTHYLSLGLGIVILVAAVFGVGISGASVDWWWLLGALALGNKYRTVPEPIGESKQRTYIDHVTADRITRAGTPATSAPAGTS